MFHDFSRNKSLNTLLPLLQSDTVSVCLVFFWLQINHVGPVPSSYYVRQHVKVDYEQCMVVKRGSSQQLDYEILFPGCVLRSAWGFSLSVPSASASLQQHASRKIQPVYMRVSFPHQVAVCHRERRHWFRRVFEGQEGGVAEGGADAGSGAQPALQRSPGARGRLADLRAAGSV